MSETLSDWKEIDPRYKTQETIESLVFFLPLLLLVSLLFWAVPSVDSDILWIPFVGLVLLFLFSVALIPRRFRSFGYVLRDNDLVFRHGIIFYRQVAVPYGRLQLVDISRGPISRILGLCELRLVTAAASTGVRIPGLSEAVAAELRDQLIGLAESRRAGL